MHSIGHVCQTSSVPIALPLSISISISISVPISLSILIRRTASFAVQVKSGDTIARQCCTFCICGEVAVLRFTNDLFGDAAAVELFAASFLEDVLGEVAVVLVNARPAHGRALLLVRDVLHLPVSRRSCKKLNVVNVCREI